MPVITLTSDWGKKDFYRGAVKGAILRQLPEAVIIDISHEIPPFDLNQAAFIIRNFYSNFPEGTIHILAINTEASIETPHTVVFHKGHYFISADNGIFSLIFNEVPEKIIELDILQDSDYFTFSTRDVFVKAACHLLSGKPMEELGHKKEKVMVKMAFQPVINADLIKGKVIYVDRYGNAFANISENLFRTAVKNRKFSITFRSPNYRINRISKSYMDVHEGEMLALFSSSGYLEIAINRGDASSLLGLKLDTSVLIEME